MSQDSRKNRSGLTVKRIRRYHKLSKKGPGKGGGGVLSKGTPILLRMERLRRLKKEKKIGRGGVTPTTNLPQKEKKTARR